MGWLDYNDHTGKIYWGYPLHFFNDVIVERSNFSQEWKEGDVISESGGKKVFPDNVTNLTLFECNLDNCEIPPGATVIGGTNKVIQIQNDGNLWFMRKNGEVWEPETPLNIAEKIELGMSVNPLDIPADNVIERPEEALRQEKHRIAQIIALGGTP